MNMHRLTLVSCFALIVAFASTGARAATITGSVAIHPEHTTPNTTYDLTARGTLDWAYWNSTSSSITAPAAPTNRKSGGTLISGISPVNGNSTVRGTSSGNNSAFTFTFTDGTSPTSGSIASPTGLFNTKLATNGVGVSFDVFLPTAHGYVVDVFGSVFGGTAVLDASLPGATDFTDNSLTSGGTGSPKASALYELVVRPDAANTTLHVQLTLSQSNNGSAQVLLAGGAVSYTVPTPAAMPAGLGLMTLMTLRRRRSAARRA